MAVCPQKWTAGDQPAPWNDSDLSKTQLTMLTALTLHATNAVLMADMRKDAARIAVPGISADWLA